MTDSRLVALVANNPDSVTETSCADRSSETTVECELALHRECAPRNTQTHTFTMTVVAHILVAHNAHSIRQASDAHERCSTRIEYDVL